MSKILVISGHPNLSESNANTTVIETLLSRHDDVAIRRLDSLYGEKQIDIVSEHEALLSASVVVLQFPFYWYSVPALMKRWIDEVLSYNFAYGPKGDKLANKHLILSVTVGGPEEAYSPLGYNHFSVEEFLRPLEQTAYLAKMQYHRPIYSHRMVYIEGVYNELSDVQNRAVEHGERLAAKIADLLHSPESIIKQFVNKWFDKLDSLSEKTEVFLPHLSKQLVLCLPEGDFLGHAGFKQWYQWALSTFKPNCRHIVEQIDITADGEYFNLSLRVNLSAHTYIDSDFAGQNVEVQVKENWRLRIIDGQHVLIEQYLVSSLGDQL